MTNQPLSSDPQTSNYPNVAQPLTPPAANQTIQSANTDGSSMESRHERYIDSTGNQIESQVEIYNNKNLSRANMRNWSITVIYFILGLLEVILGLRFIFRLLGASTSSSFTMFLYNLAHEFISPFNGIFNDQTLTTHSVFELSTLVAMLIYALIGWGLVALIGVLFPPMYNSHQQITKTRRSR